MSSPAGGQRWKALSTHPSMQQPADPRVAELACAWARPAFFFSFRDCCPVGSARLFCSTQAIQLRTAAPCFTAVSVEVSFRSFFWLDCLGADGELSVLFLDGVSEGAKPPRTYLLVARRCAGACCFGTGTVLLPSRSSGSWSPYLIQRQHCLVPRADSFHPRLPGT